MLKNLTIQKLDNFTSCLLIIMFLIFCVDLDIIHSGNIFHKK